MFRSQQCHREPSLKEAVEKYFDDNQLDSRYCNTDNLWPPLILFPDLTSDYYKEIFVDEEKGWLSLRIQKEIHCASSIQS